MLLVEGLTANLINISQICDQGMNVNSNQSECIISSKIQEVLMKGTRSNGNCYLWISQNKSHPLTCLISKVDQTKLWNYKLGHLNLKSMKHNIFKEDIKGLTKSQDNGTQENDK